MPDLSTIKLPNGSDFIVRLAYSSKESHGVIVLIVISTFSMVAILGLLAAIGLSAYNTRTSLEKHLFVRTHVAAYFVCFLLSDFLQAVGSIMNAQWVNSGAVTIGDHCTAQAVIKEMADVSTAFWTVVISIHTFFLLVLEIKLRTFILWTTLVGGWSAIFAIVISGPAVVEVGEKGPFYAISGYWCWISANYPAQRVTLDYMLMFLAATFSFTVHMLIYLKMRGNIIIDGWRVSVRRVNGDNQGEWHGEKPSEESLHIAKTMLMYPLAYVLLILPIAITRFATWAGHNVPFEVTIFTAAIFMLSGVVNVTLFVATRSVLPPQTVKMFKISAPKLLHAPRQREKDDYYQSALDPYYAPYTAQQEKFPNYGGVLITRSYHEKRDSTHSHHSHSHSQYSTDTHPAERYGRRSTDVPPRFPPAAHFASSRTGSDHSSMYDEKYHSEDFSDIKLSPTPRWTSRAYNPDRI